LFFPNQLTFNQNDINNQRQTLKGLDLKGSKASVKRQKNVLLAGMEWGYQIAQDSHQVSLVIKFDEQHLIFDLDWMLNEGSKIHKTLSHLEGNAHPLLHELGAASFIISAHLPEVLIVGLVKEWNRIALGATQGEKKEDMTPKRERINLKSSKSKKTRKRRAQEASLPPILGESKTVINDYLLTATQAAQELTGEIVLAAVPYKLDTQKDKVEASPTAEGAAPTSEIFISRDNQKALRWVGLFGHKGREKTQEKLRATLDIYRDKEVKKSIRRRGIVVKVNDDKSLEGLSGGSIHIRSRMPRTPKSLRPFRPQLKELYNAHLWIGERRGVVGFARSWKQTLRRHALSMDAKSTEPKSPTKNYVLDAFNIGVKAPLLFAYLNPVTLLSSLKRGRSGSILLPLQMMFSSLPNTEGIGLTIGREERSVKLRLTIAQALLNTIREGMSGTRSNSQSPVSH
jgi:hypothetical protein